MVCSFLDIVYCFSSLFYKNEKKNANTSNKLNSKKFNAFEVKKKHVNNSKWGKKAC